MFLVRPGRWLAAGGGTPHRLSTDARAPAAPVEIQLGRVVTIENHRVYGRKHLCLHTATRRNLFYSLNHLPDLMTRNE